MDPLAKVRGFRHVSDSLPGMSGEIALARAPRTRYIVAIDGVVGHVEATDHEAAAQDAAETYWLASEIRERVIVEVVEPVSAGGARHLVCVVPEETTDGLARPEGAAAMPISGRGRRRDMRGNRAVPEEAAEDVTAGETALHEGGVVTSAARSDGEPATAPPRLTPDHFGGAQSAGLTPSVRPLREAAGRPEQGAA